MTSMTMNKVVRQEYKFIIEFPDYDSVNSGPQICITMNARKTIIRSKLSHVNDIQNER